MRWRRGRRIRRRGRHATTGQPCSIQGNGPQVAVRADGTTINAIFEGLAFDRHGTTPISDDTYLVSSFAGASVIYRYYADPQSGDDGLGPVRTSANVSRDIFTGAFGPGDGSVLTLFDITNVLQGGLDYVQLGRLAPTLYGGNYGFFAVGRTQSSMIMPTTGSARFDGGTRGAYTNGAGTTYATASDITLNANFGTGAVTGSASNFRMLDSTGAAVTPPHSLNFDFTANIAGSTFTGTAGSTSMTGSVNGAFYGEPSTTPAEVGLTYTLREITGGGMLVGVGGLKKN